MTLGPYFVPSEYVLFKDAPGDLPAPVPVPVDEAGESMSVFASTDEAIAALRRGEMIVVVDSPDRENEGDLVMAAELMDAEPMNFMAVHGRGLVCVPMLAERLGELGIPPMARQNTDPHGTAFHVGVDLVAGTTTGISAADRAAAARALADPASRAADFSMPGHLFPLACHPGGLGARHGHTEASVELVRHAGLEPAAVICEIADEDGSMARLPSLTGFARRHGLLIVNIEDLAAELISQPTVQRIATTHMPIGETTFAAIGYRDPVDGREHMALVLGDPAGEDALVRVHSECRTGDVFGSRRCDCGAQLELALETIRQEGRGAVVYLCGHEGRGIGLAEKLRAYELQDAGLDTVEANLELGHEVDTRDYGAAVGILRDLGAESVRLMTNNPRKSAALEQYGVRVSDRVPSHTVPTPENLRYLQAKRSQLGHLLGHFGTELFD